MLITTIRHNVTKLFVSVINRGTGIKPLTLTSFWHRRICEATILIASIVLALFAWALLSDIRGSSGNYIVTPLPAVLAGLTLAAALASYFFAPKQFQTPATYAAYLLLVGTTGSLIATTGLSSSPFVALWMATAVFAGIFGIPTLAVMFVAVNIIFVAEILGGNLSRTLVFNIVLAGELPLLISYILWHSKSRHEQNKERAYYDLANELNQVSNKAEVVINAIGDGVIAIDNKGIIELINPAAQRIVGWGRQDAIGLDYKSVLQLLDKNGHDLTKSNDPIFDVLTTNQQKREDSLILQTNSGKRLSVSIVASPIGKIGAGAIIVFRDITKEIAEGKEQAEFISTASHEMRTPVASIEGYLGLALNPATATIDDKARDYITKAHDAAQHLGRLFQDLLDITKVDDRRLSNNPKVINAIEFSNTIIDALKPKADAKNLRIMFKPTTSNGSEGMGLHSIAPVFYLYADNDHLREVMSNLVDNAIKYTPAGEVIIDVYGDKDHVVISIADSGIGIPAEDIPHLFQKFYRVDNSDTREIGGTGLGLYLCRRLIEAMDGRIWVESEYKKGSTFFIELPRISHEEANRLIEAASNTGSEEQTFVQTNKHLESSPEEQRAALTTPIIREHGRIVTARDSDDAANKEATLMAHVDPVLPPAMAAALAAKKAAATDPTQTPPVAVQLPTTPAPVASPAMPAPQPASPTPAPAAPTTPSAPQTSAPTPAGRFVGPIVPPPRPPTPPAP